MVDGLQVLSADQAGLLAVSPHATVRFLPSQGSFVGSDLLAGVLATRMHEDSALTVLVDLGINGEIVVGNRARLLCASTAAGPAFEGARISCGMRAATGAISEVTITEDRLHCRVVGQTAPRGICGSGLVDAVACALDLGLVQPDGKLASGGDLPLFPPISLLQSDLRELQLAKGVIAAGIRILLQQWGATPNDVERVWLAGAFGNYINRASARRIGLIRFPGGKAGPGRQHGAPGREAGPVQPAERRGSLRRHPVADATRDPARRSRVHEHLRGGDGFPLGENLHRRVGPR